MVSEAVTKSLLTVIGFSTGLLSLLILRKLQDEDLSMTRMKLKPKSTIFDFKVIMGANIVMFFGFMMYIVGVLANNESFWILSKAVGAIFGLSYAAVLYRWWNRF